MVAAAKNNRTSIEELSNLGMRVAKPNLTFSSFSGKKIDKHIKSNCVFLNKKGKKKIIETKISSLSSNDLNPKWSESREVNNFFQGLETSEQISLFSEVFLGMIKQEGSKKNSITTSENFKIYREQFKTKQEFSNYLKEYVIYDLESQALRGITNTSLKTPLGIHGERLDLFLASFSNAELKKLYNFKYLISWLDEIIIDKEGKYRLSGLKTEGKSSLYFTDKFMEDETLFNIENANEGILHILFYLALFISNKSPGFFAIDNIETALNPSLCRHLTEVLSTMNPNKQALITTHNPAILDGLDLTNDDIRLFTVRRTEKGDTACSRIKFKKGDEKEFKLSEMWMQGMLGAIPKNF